MQPSDGIEDRRFHQWWVAFGPVFGDRDLKWWDRYFTAPGFRHVFCFCQIKPGLILIINPLIDRPVLRLEVHHPVMAIEDLLAAGWRVVVVPRRSPAYCPLDNRLRWPKIVKIVTCASTVAEMIGLQRLPWTPKGLYRYLMHNGAEELFHHGRIKTQGSITSREGQSGAPKSTG